MRRIFDHFFTVLGALLFLQIPLFMHLYEQQLIGHVQELKWQRDDMEKSASENGKNLDQFIQKFVNSSDDDFSSEGQRMEKVKMRSEKLTLALNKLKGASPLFKPFIFFAYLEWDILISTFNSFTPGIVFNWEALIYLIMGMLFGWLLFQMLFFSLKKIKAVFN